MGYKSEQFAKPVDENLFCSICQEVFQDPVSCKDGHTFCSECIEKWLQTSKTCPLDNSVITDNKLARNYIVKGIIENLEVCCYYDESDESKNDHTQEGNVEEKCSWTGKLQDVAKHRNVCGFQLVQCKHPKCTAKEQRRKLEDHMKTCDFKVVVCLQCRVTLIQSHVGLHEKEYCPKRYVLCPNGCSAVIIRMYVDKHLATFCNKALVDCPFKDQGCSVQVERQHVDKHVQDNMAAHMLLLAKENNRLKEELNHVKENLKKSTGSYLWITNGEPESPVFLECGQRWKLFLYRRKDGQFITFYLVWNGDVNGLYTQDGSIPAFVRLSILSNTPQKSHHTVTKVYTFTKVDNSLGFLNFIKEVDADLPAYSEGSLKVKCSIQICYSGD